MPTTAISVSSVPRTYAELWRCVENVVFAGRAKIEAAWLRTYHDTGRLVHEHLLLNRDRADYGAKVFTRLADDTGISKRVLYECVQLIVALEIAPGVLLEEKLRLRGLDCPEMNTPEGKAAKRFVDALLPADAAVTLTTTKPDKYDRYLADVFVDAKSGSVLQSSAANVPLTKAPSAALSPRAAPFFLNNALLENAHATRKDAWEFSDWERNLA